MTAPQALLDIQRRMGRFCVRASVFGIRPIGAAGDAASAAQVYEFLQTYKSNIE